MFKETATYFINANEAKELAYSYNYNSIQEFYDEVILKAKNAIKSAALQGEYSTSIYVHDELNNKFKNWSTAQKTLFLSKVETFLKDYGYKVIFCNNQNASYFNIFWS